MDSEIDTVIEALRASRRPIGALRPPGRPGLYAVFLRDREAVGDFSGGADGDLYIGQSSDLARRDLENHFSSEGTGFSTLRRSLGAILKTQLGLTAIPRGPGSSKTNFTNFRFKSDGEHRLTEWMRESLEVGVFTSADGESIERDLIAKIRPPLNLTGWNNPSRKELKALRKICADEARATRRIP